MNDEREGWTSASNAQADALCEGRHLAQAGLPDVETDDARFGTQIHDALKKGDPAGLAPDQVSIYDGCVEIREAKMREGFGEDVSKVKIIKEERLWCKVKKKWGHTGKPDFVARLGLKALILEYKTLPGEQPDVSTNEQLRDQAVLAAHSYTVPQIYVGVVQPLVTYDCALCRYDEAAINESERRMFKRVEASNNPEARRTPHEKACKFCKAKTSCVEYQRWSAATVPKTQPLTDVPMAQWTPDQCARFCEMQAVAQSWIDTAKEEMKRRLNLDPGAIPGWTLKPGAVRHPITDPNELHRRFLDLGGTSDQFMGCVDISKKPLEGLVRSVTNLKGKQFLSKMEELLAGITDTKYNQPSLARRKEELE